MISFNGALQMTLSRPKPIIVSLGLMAAVANCINAMPLPSQLRKPPLPAGMQFEPSHREPGDCGPASLYVLMRLLNKDVTISQVKNLIRISPESGCSLTDIAKAAELLGFPVEIRFVKPKEVSRLHFPCILHVTGSLKTGIGHFGVVTKYDSKGYSVVDTDLKRLTHLA
jgi:hypothetical protein